MKVVLWDGTEQILYCDLCGDSEVSYSLDIELCGDCMWEHWEELP